MPRKQLFETLGLDRLRVFAGAGEAGTRVRGSEISLHPTRRHLSVTAVGVTVVNQRSIGSHVCARHAGA